MPSYLYIPLFLTVRVTLLLANPGNLGWMKIPPKYPGLSSLVAILTYQAELQEESKGDE